MYFLLKKKPSLFLFNGFATFPITPSLHLYEEIAFFRVKRLAATVCMLPRVLVPEDVAVNRKMAVEKGLALTHWPNEFNPHSFG